jgi:hypothetical protein
MHPLRISIKMTFTSLTQCLRTGVCSLMAVVIPSPFTFLRPVTHYPVGGSVRESRSSRLGEGRSTRWPFASRAWCLWLQRNDRVFKGAIKSAVAIVCVVWYILQVWCKTGIVVGSGRNVANSLLP